ncbi:hypothetical protein LEP1GSC058_4029 [Leptospira fainei serovar Hurstbridge str. BUT 6]|uniref:Oleate hydratase n=1 Tax=Leptospira fainei serovar Hurstbridge str. BUT 6 TaxID=1193011 RepID=S3W2A1_9LEPT|nr:oleate hydratase [Leptospira fainei]EPG74427.1 hypothetical protein LEP1GSC058_4029 [Leptospira fainei serovar Hurstbridge str. BUT 6]
MKKEQKSSYNGKEKIENRAYLVGGGISSLSAAAFLIRDAGFPGNKISILEESAISGGSLDGSGTAREGYVIRGGRMMNLSYLCTYDLFSSIPSSSDPSVSVYQEILNFNRKIKSHSLSRVVEKGRKIDVSKMGFNHKNRMELLRLLVKSEESCGNDQIRDFFSDSFFETNFWYMWATMFAFQPWHSLVEFKRYLHRFIHEFPRINTLAGVDRTPLNQFDSLVLPLQKWLQRNGVKFEYDCKVTDIDFQIDTLRKKAVGIRYTQKRRSKNISLNDNDLLLITLGSMTEGSDLGSMKKAPKLLSKKDGGSWPLWEKIASKNNEFGHPKIFDERISESKWESFTVTFKDPSFFDRMEQFTGNKAGTGGLVTIKDSNWLMSVVLAHQPHFLNQPPNIQVCWGYALFPDKIGNFVHKRMSDCSGEEILRELLGHLQFDDDLKKIIKHAICIPCMMPFITSQFLTRESGDRPAVVPKGAVNFGFMGQFCEIPDDVVFTVEYSVRSAQMAVYSLLNVKKEIPKVYKDPNTLKMLFEATKTMFR